MMRAVYSLLGGLCLFQLTACQSDCLSPEALNEYVFDPRHQLQQAQQVGEAEVRVTYQPVDLLVSRELTGLATGSRLNLDSLRHKYSGSTYFLLTVSRQGREVLQPREGFAAYSGLLQTLAFQMQEHVRLVTSRGDTLRPTNYYLDRTYSNATATQLLFAFPRPITQGNWCFQLQECGLGTGNLSFPFEAARLAAAPALVIQ